MPGRVALSLRPEIFEELAGRHRLVLVSGTNGKTTTTLLLAQALRELGPVISNSDGANLSSGVVSTLIAARGRGSAVAVLEVDEVALVDLLGRCAPELVVLLNLSRDQLDRTAEVGDHVRAWSDALSHVPETVLVANADDALVVAAVTAARPDGRGVEWVWAQKFFRDDVPVCPRCGTAWDAEAQDWCCPGCGLRRPPSDWGLSEGLVLRGSARYPLDLALPGRANASNALMAAAAAARMSVPVAAALAAMATVQDVEGRYGRTRVDGHDVRLLLAKNPAGWLEAFEQIAESSSPVIVSINARDADGSDPSWIWDVPFECLRGRQVVATGERRHDLAVRLSYAEVAHEVALDYGSALTLVRSQPCFVIANYTAFVAARALLARAE